MPDDTASRSAEPITALVAERVRTLRGAAGWTQAELAERVARYGLPWNRATVVHLEKRAASGKGGGRESLSVQELLALALVFDVPPVLLIADPRQPGSVPIASDADGEVDPWVALLWIIGGADRSIAKSDLANYGRESWLIAAGWEVSEALGTLKTRVRGGRDEAENQQRNDDRHRAALEQMNTALIRIKGAGAPPPPLPDLVYRRAAELDVQLDVQAED